MFNADSGLFLLNLLNANQTRSNSTIFRTKVLFLLAVGKNSCSNPIGNTDQATKLKLKPFDSCRNAINFVSIENSKKLNKIYCFYVELN